MVDLRPIMHKKLKEYFYDIQQYQNIFKKYKKMVYYTYKYIVCIIYCFLQKLSLHNDTFCGLWSIVTLRGVFGKIRS